MSGNRVNYVLVDFENVQPASLAGLEQEYFRLLIFLGKNQHRVPVDLAIRVQTLGERAEYVQVPQSGHNALDLHIAYYLGLLAAEKPDSHFHIVSKDADFDPLIEHLKSKKIFVGRVKTIAEIPCLKMTNCRSPAERVAVVVERLQKSKSARPATLKTLCNTITALFQKQLTDEEIAMVVQILSTQGYLSITGTKVSYPLPDNAPSLHPG